MLPGPLRDRFTALGRLTHTGAEADVLLVRAADGTQWVVKVYRRDVAVDRTVGALLARANPPHVVRQLEVGQDHGRDYEVQEYAADGDLRSLVGDDPAPLPVPLVTEVVRQLSTALRALHDAGIVHRDLKPDNVLIRRRAPLDLALTDFGISRRVDMTTTYSTADLTPAYGAPESLAGVVSRSVDWWSLGMITRELATGKRPFAGIDDRVVRHHLVSRSIDVEGVADARLRLLCRGLLTRDGKRRWGAAEVADWLAGGNPPVADPAEDGPAPVVARTPLGFAGAQLVDRRTAAEAFVAHWPDVVQRYLSRVGVAGQVSEGWRTLRTWMQQFDDPAVDRVEERIELIDRYLLDQVPPDVKLVRLLHWLDPDLPPVFQGLLVTPDQLVAIAAQAMAEADAPTGRGATSFLDRLLHLELLPLLSGFPGGEQLSDVDARWRDLLRQWDLGAGALTTRLPQLATTIRGWKELPRVRQALLDLALRPADRAGALRAHNLELAAELAGRVPWFDWLLRAAGDDPVRLLQTAVAADVARAEVARAALRQDRARATQLRRREQLNEYEARRQAGVWPAMRWVALGGLALAGVWAAIASALVLVGRQAGDTSLDSYVLVAGGYLFQLGGEIALAGALGGDYHPRWSLLTALGRWLTYFGRRAAGVARAHGNLGCLGVLGGLVLYPTVFFGLSWLLILTRSWTVLPIGLTAAYELWALIRLLRWRRAHSRYRRELVGE